MPRVRPQTTTQETELGILLSPVEPRSDPVVSRAVLGRGGLRDIVIARLDRVLPCVVRVLLVVRGELDAEDGEGAEGDRVVGVLGEGILAEDGEIGGETEEGEDEILDERWKGVS